MLDQHVLIEPCGEINRLEDHCHRRTPQVFQHVTSREGCGRGDPDPPGPERRNASARINDRDRAAIGHRVGGLGGLEHRPALKVGVRSPADFKAHHRLVVGWLRSRPGSATKRPDDGQ